MAALRFRPRSEQGEALASALLKRIERYEFQSGKKKNKRRTKDMLAFLLTTVAFVHDLVRARAYDASGGWLYRATRNGSEIPADCSMSARRAAKNALLELGLIERPEDLFQDYEQPRHLATHYRATDELVALCAENGIHAETLSDHFRPREYSRGELILCRRPAKWVGCRRIPGKPIDIEVPMQVEVDAVHISEFNEFLGRQELRGATFTGLVRIYNEGTEEGYGWDKGGRLYDLDPGSYMSIPSEQRKDITINGEAVVEIDIKCCNLTILYGLAGETLNWEQDPYEVGRLPRPVGKAFVTAFFGSNGSVKRWPKGVSEELKLKHGIDAKRDYPIEAVRVVMLKHHPVLQTFIDKGLTWADLMYLESRVIFLALYRLCGPDGVPCFPIHDCLLCPVSKREEVSEVLVRSFEEVCKVKPRLG
ncbi:MAG: hypothetical protein AAFU68_06155 [Pseudomonadota bacterium]